MKNLFIIAALFLGGASVCGVKAASVTSVASETIHLGGEVHEWAYFEGRTPQGTDLRLKFQGTRNDREHTLVIRQDDVKQDWSVALNGKRLGQLFLMEADLVQLLTIPPETIREGENELYIWSRVPDEILIHSLAIIDDSKTNVLSTGLRVTVKGADGAPLPARITILDENGSLAAMGNPGDTNVAVRPGIAYTPNGTATLTLRPGKYTVFATRGPEYSLAREELMVGENDASVELTLNREVNTSEWVAADTHIHTLALSRHGDALLEERLITLAGEGVELPVATEHNLHSDYDPTAKALGVDRYLTAIPGNEVTTKKGHFNIFPVPLNGKPADDLIENWPDLLKTIRAARDVRVVILNHPTDIHAGFTPFASTNFNQLTAKNLRGDFDFTFDAMEVINSGAMRSDWMEPFRCWFALLNRGYRVTGVAASDSHDVSRFIVGQGRTYIRGNDTNVAQLNVAQLCDNLKQGRAVASLGLFPQLTLTEAPDALDLPTAITGEVRAQGSGPGDLHKGESRFFEVIASVDFPEWMQSEGRTVLTLYENGQAKLVFPFEMPKTAGKPLAFKARFPKPKADAWYVLVAEAPGVTNAYWSIARPYQPSSPEWKPTMLGATNPIYLDADQDGKYLSPRKSAERLNDQYVSPHDLIPVLSGYDSTIAIHIAEILHEAGVDLNAVEFKPRLANAAPHVQRAFADYLGSIGK